MSKRKKRDDDDEHDEDDDDDEDDGDNENDIKHKYLQTICWEEPFAGALGNKTRRRLARERGD